MKHKRFNPRARRWITTVALSVLWCLLAFLAPQTASAHGGVIIDGGLTEEYEWLIAVSPYPVTPGDTVITLLIYDLDTYAPINGLDTALYLTPPDSSERAGPFDLLADPEQYPGDYSNIFEIDQAGDWSVTFVVNTEGEPLELSSTFTVQPGSANEPRPTAEGAADVAATATVFAQNVAAARQTSPEAETTMNITDSGALSTSGTAPVALSESGSSSEAGAGAAGSTMDISASDTSGIEPPVSAFGRSTWLWVLVGALPFALLFLWFLRAPDPNEPADEYDVANDNADDEAL